MKLLGEVFNKEIVTRAFRPVVKVICDKCGNELKEHYAYVCTSHSRWGNDSIESVEYHHYCMNCVKDVFASYVDNNEMTDRFEYEVCNVADLFEDVQCKDDGTLFITDWDECKILKENK